MKIKFYTDQKTGLSIADIGKELGYDMDGIVERMRKGISPTKKERFILAELLKRLDEYRAMPLREFKKMAAAKRAMPLRERRIK